MAAGLSVNRRGGMQPGHVAEEKVRFVVDLNVRFATEPPIYAFKSWSRYDDAATRPLKKGPLSNDLSKPLVPALIQKRRYPSRLG